MIEVLRENMHRDPFVPFRIVLTNGHAYEVTNPDLVAIGQTMVFYFYPRSDKQAWLRTNQIAAIESLPTAA